MSCIYKKSRYYREAKLEAVDVVEPLSYAFLNKESEVKKSRPIAKTGKTLSRFIMDSSLVRHISSLKSQRAEVEKALKVNQATRKNSYMSGTNIDHFSKKSTKEMLGQISHNFFKGQGKQQMMRFLQLAFCLFGRDNAFPIKDYALSTYTIYYNGSNKLTYNAIEEHLQQQFLQYQHNILIDNSLLARPQLRQPTRYDSLSAAKQYIQEINEIRSRDPFCSGVHLYINDLIPNQNSNPGEYARDEQQFLPFLQFHIFVALSVLADGQSAIIRVRGTFTQKTSQMIYLLKLCFHRINFVKNIFSNPLTHDKYVICQGFIKQYSTNVLSHIQHNYNLLFEDQKWLLVDARILVVSEFQKNIHTYNDLSPIMKSKQLHNQYNENQCLAIFPHKKAAIEKASQLKIPRVQYYVQQLQAMIPDIEQKQEVKSKQIKQKQGIVIDFDLLGLSLDNQTKKIDYFDISQKKKEEYDVNIEKYISQGNKTIEEKRQKKKTKKDKEEEQ